VLRGAACKLVCGAVRRFVVSSATGIVFSTEKAMPFFYYSISETPKEKRK
jgi:hypothetical protein